MLRIVSGGESLAALSTSTSHFPIFCATSWIARSFATDTAKMLILVVLEADFISSEVALRVEVVRPRSAMCDAPAMAKARAVARPMPLP